MDPDNSIELMRYKDIFTTFITSIVPALADPSNAYNLEHIYVLHSLAEYQSIVLLTDIDDAESLILSLFTTCFDIISNSSKASTGEEIVKNVEYDMTRVLVSIIDEVPTLPEDVVDTIIVQFLRVDPRTASQIDRKGKKHGVTDGKQETLGLKEYPAAYNMAKALCSNCPEKMTNHISTYFNNIIVDASDHFSNINDGYSKHGHRKAVVEDSGDESEDLQQLRKAHKLIRELWRACPEVLHNVVPQLDTELGAESVSLRRLATETIGDLVAGIGVAGPPKPNPPNPAAWPPLRLGQSISSSPSNPLTTPFAPRPFSQAHGTAYENFIGRRHDKSPTVRAVWATAAARIILTSAGGLGLDKSEEESLAKGLASMLTDAEEKVRQAAVEAIGQFGFTDVVNKLGAHGSVTKENSMLANLSERVKDRRQTVRARAFEVLGGTWGTASYELELGSEAVVEAIGAIPQQIFSAWFTNDPEIQLSIDETIHELLLPMNFPPTKGDISKSASQRKRTSQVQNVDSDIEQTDPDQIRLRRILTLYRGLDEKARKVFFHMMQRQVKMSQFVTAYLESCEAFNGGVIEENEPEVKARLTRLVEVLSKLLPDSSKASADLWKFARMHDRRNYQLIRFAMAAESDYRTVIKAIKELTKRIQNGASGTSSLLETLTPLLYRCALLFLNRSHIPAVIQVSRTNEHNLGEAAHELLKVISTVYPAVLKTQIVEMCDDLQTNAPSATEAEDVTAADTLKACAGFAREFPKELPKDRKLQVALTNYAIYSSSPRAAKHAVTILMQTADKKEMYAKDLISKAVKNFDLESPHALARLATMSQITLLAPAAAEAEQAAISHICFEQILMKEPPTSPSKEDAYIWSEEQSATVTLKEWSLRVLVNRLRSQQYESAEEKAAFLQESKSVFSLLDGLVSNQGELLKNKSTPSDERPRLRLIAAKAFLKLCSHRRSCEELVTPNIFNKIALVVQDPQTQVRKAFVDKVKQHLAVNRLSARWFSVLFLLAFEPEAAIRTGTSMWLKGQSQNIIRTTRSTTNGKSHHQNVIELLFARLLSLLAHHPDYPTDSDSETYGQDLIDFTRYILYYLSSVATEDNLSLVFHIAQRVKQTRDGISSSVKLEEIYSNRLYVLSDLAQATIRDYAEILSTTKGHEKGVNLLQTWPGRLKLPGNIFKAFDASNRDQALTIAEKDFLKVVPEVREQLEDVVKKYMRSASGHKSSAKKRKTQDRHDDDDDLSESGLKKKPKKSSTAKLPIRKASAPHSDKKKRPTEKVVTAEQPSRKSSRKSGANVSYADLSDSEADVDMEQQEDSDADQTAKSKRTASSRTAGRSSSAPIADDSSNLSEPDDAMDVDKPPAAKESGETETEAEEDEDHKDDDDSAKESTPSPVSKPSSSSSKRQLKKPTTSSPTPASKGKTTAAPAKSKSKPNNKSATSSKFSKSHPKPKPSEFDIESDADSNKNGDEVVDDEASDEEASSPQNSKAAMSATAKKLQNKHKASAADTQNGKQAKGTEKQAFAGKKRGDPPPAAAGGGRSLTRRG